MLLAITALASWRAFLPGQGNGPEQVAPSSGAKEKNLLLDPTRKMRRDFDLTAKLLGGSSGEDGIRSLTAGDRLQVSVLARQDAYVGVWTVDADGTIVQLFPNTQDPDPFIKAGQERLVPRQGARTVPTEGRSPDRIWVVAVSERWEPTFDPPEGDFQRFLTESGRRRWRGARLTDLAEAVLEYHVEAP
jgi:hypothetical protein